MQMNCGNLCSASSEANSLKITWKIPEYLSLLDIPNYSLDSSPFIFANATWCLQLHPKKTLDEMFVSLKRLHSLIYRHNITCMFDVLKQNGEYLKDEHEREYRPLTFYDDCYFEYISYRIGDEEVPDRFGMVSDQNVLASNGTLVLMGHLIFEEMTDENHHQKCEIDNSTMYKTDKTKNDSSILSLTFSKVQSLKITWKVPEYLSILEKDEGYSLRSPSFEFFYATWFLKLHPNLMDENGDFTGLSIVRSRFQVPVFQEIIYALDVLTEDDKPFEYSCDFNLHYKKFSLNENCEIKESPQERFNTRSMLVDCLVVDGEGNVTFFIQIFYEEDPVKDSAAQKMLDELNMYRKLGGDLKNFLLNGSGYDLILKVNEKEFRVHRQILSARSPVFQSMVTHDMAEKNHGVVDVPDCDPQSMEQFLLYVYSGKVDSLDETNVLGLYYTADKYDIMHLKEICRDFIRNSLSCCNISDIVQLAMIHSDDDLVKSVAEFFQKNENEIIKTAEWISFINGNKDIANEFLNKTSGMDVSKKSKKKLKSRYKKRRH